MTREITSHFPHYLAPEIIKRNKYGTDDYRNKRLSGIKAAAQHVVRANGGPRPENGSTGSGQMNGCAGGMPGVGNLEKVSPGLP